MEQDCDKTESEQKRAVNTENEGIEFYICSSMITARSSPRKWRSKGYEAASIRSTVDLGTSIAAYGMR